MNGWMDGRGRVYDIPIQRMEKKEKEREKSFCCM